MYSRVKVFVQCINFLIFNTKYKDIDKNLSMSGV